MIFTIMASAEFCHFVTPPLFLFVKMAFSSPDLLNEYAFNSDISWLPGTAGELGGGVILQWYRDEKVLEMGGNDVYTTLCIYLSPVNPELKNG